MAEFRVPTFKKKEQLQTRQTPVTPIGAAVSGAALTKAFEVGGDVADLFVAREVQRKGENDKINAANLYYGPSGFKDQIRKVSTEATATTGKASENIGNEFITSYDKLSEETLNSDAVDNPEQKLILEGLILKGRGGAVTPVARHQAVQHQLRKKADQEAVIVDATMSVTEDPASLNDSIVDLRLALDGQPERLAKEEEALKKIATEAEAKIQWDTTWNLAMPLDLESGEAVIKNRLKGDDQEKMLRRFRTEKGLELDRIEKQETARVEQVERDFIVKNRDNALSGTEILEAGLPIGKTQTWLNVIDKKAADKLGGRDAITESDSAVYLDLLDKANSNKIKDINKEVLSKIGTTLTDTDAGYIEQRWDKARKPELTEQNRLLKEAEKLGEQSIIKNFGNMFESRSPEDLRRAREYTAALREKLVAGEGEGISRESMLTPGNKNYVVDDLIRAYQATIPEKLNEQIDRFRSVVPEAQPEKRKKNETPAEYLKRTKK